MTPYVAGLVDQATQSIDASLWNFPDTWVGVNKTLALLYQFDGYPLQLWLGALDDPVKITPDEPYLEERTKFSTNIGRGRLVGKTSLPSCGA